MNDYRSKLAHYSVGVVAANKKLSSDLIEVVLMEQMPMFNGELSDHTSQYQAEGQAQEGESFQVELEMTNSVQAKWLPLSDTNRITPPDVRRGEIVAVYRFGDVDQYWWTTLLQDKKLRRLETVIYSYSNEREENKPVNADNAYWMEVSTHGKYIHLHTSKNDKEPFTYDIQINTKDGCITIKDDDDNYVFMNSKERQIKLHNKDTSFIDIDKKRIHIHAIDEVKVTTKDFIVNASNNIKLTTSQYSLQTSGYRVNASSYTTTVPTANFSSNINLGASLSAGANVTAGATVHGSTISGSSYRGGHHN